MSNDCITLGDAVGSQVEFIGALHRSPGYVTAAEPPSNQNLIKRFKIQNDLKRCIMRSFGTNISNIKCAEAEFCAHIKVFIHSVLK